MTGRWMSLAAILLSGVASAASVDEARQALAGLYPGHAEEVLERAAVQGMLQAVDPAGRLLTPDQQQALANEQDGRFVTVGVLLTRSNGLPRVAEILAGTPAEDSPLRIGDLLESIDGHSVRGLSLCAVERRLHGAADSTASLERQTADGGLESVEVPRSAVAIPGIAAAESWARDLGYIRLRGVFPGTAESFLEVLEAWREKDKASGLILDLRGAAGGAVEGVRSIAALFVRGEDTAFQWQSPAGDTESLDLPAAERWSLPVVTLVDEQTTGAAELLAALLRDRSGGSMLLGRKSSGDPMLRNVLPLANGDALFLVSRHLVTADGTLYEGKAGVEPHITVARGEDHPSAADGELPPLSERASEAQRELMTRARGDAVLTRALDLLLALRALRNADSGE